MPDFITNGKVEPQRLIMQCGEKRIAWPFTATPPTSPECWPRTSSSEGWLYVLAAGDIALRVGADVVVLHGVEAQWGNA